MLAQIIKKRVATLYFLILCKWLKTKLVIASDMPLRQMPPCRKTRQRKKTDTENKVSGQKTVAYTGDQFA